jgi:hypothetical protein
MEYFDIKNSSKDLPSLVLESDASPDRVSAVRYTRFAIAVTFEMPGVSWDYVNELHHAYRFHERWPSGMLCHITGSTDDGVTSIGIWTDVDTEAKYFGETAVNVISEFINANGPTHGDQGAMDYQPTQRSIQRLTLGPQAHMFADIGIDLDASAVGQLGGAPVAVEIKLGDCSYDDYDAAMTELGYNDSLPNGLIAQLAQRNGDGLSETQIWASAEAAKNSMESEFFPVIRRTVPNAEMPEPRILKRISFSAAEMDPGSAVPLRS